MLTLFWAIHKSSVNTHSIPWPQFRDVKEYHTTKYGKTNYVQRKIMIKPLTVEANFVLTILTVKL